VAVEAATGRRNMGTEGEREEKDERKKTCASLSLLARTRQERGSLLYNRMYY
jgi:hypothetical protein